MLAAAHFSASRWRQAPAQAGCARASVSRAPKAAPAWKAASASLGAPALASAQAGTAGDAAGLAVAGSRRIMCLEGKVVVRFVPRFSAENAQLVGTTKRMIRLHYHLFCSLYEK
jgi:hypothetical protein